MYLRCCVSHFVLILQYTSFTIIFFLAVHLSTNDKLILSRNVCQIVSGHKNCMYNYYVFIIFIYNYYI